MFLVWLFERGESLIEYLDGGVLLGWHIRGIVLVSFVSEYISSSTPFPILCLHSSNPFINLRCMAVTRSVHLVHLRQKVTCRF